MRNNHSSQGFPDRGEGMNEYKAKCPDCGKAIKIAVKVKLVIENGFIRAIATPNLDEVWAHWEKKHSGLGDVKE